jgi:tetratricopeptide (TPR) repeat protein
LKALKAKWEKRVAERRKLQDLPKGMMMRETQEPSGRVTREYSWQTPYLNGRAEEAIQAAKAMIPTSTKLTDLALAERLAAKPRDNLAREARGLLKPETRKKRFTREERVGQYCLHMSLGQFYFQRKRYQDAGKQFKVAYGHATKLRNVNLIQDAVFDLGAAYGMLGDHVKAERPFRQAIHLRPDDAEAHCNLGTVLEHKGDVAGAVAQFREAIRIEPNLAEAHYNLGNALWRQGDTEGAVTEYRKAVRIKPDFSEAHNNLGVALGQKGDIEGAVAEYRDAIRVMRNNAQAHYNLGVCLAKKGDLEGAISEYKKAIRFKPDNAEAHYNLGVALTKKTDLGGAVSAFKKAIRLKPDYAEAHSNLGSVLLGMGRHEEGIAFFERAIRFRTNLPDSGRLACVNFVRHAMSRAVILLRGEDTRGASKIFGRIRKLYYEIKGEKDIHTAIEYVLFNLIGKLMVQDHKMGTRILSLLRLPEVERLLVQGRYLREVAILRELLISAYDPEKIVLFGSCAKGDIGRGSDIDMLIVKEGVEGKDLIQRRMEVIEAIGAVNPEVRLEPIVLTRKELEEKLKSSSFYRQEIMEKGWVIYEKRG